MSCVGEGHVKIKSWHAADRAMCIHLLVNLRSAPERLSELGAFGGASVHGMDMHGYTPAYIYIYIYMYIIYMLNQTKTPNAYKILCQTQLRSPSWTTTSGWPTIPSSSQIHNSSRRR